MRNSKALRIVVGLVLLAYISAGLSRITFNVDILRLLPTHLPQVKGLSLFLKYFAQPNELIITIQAKDADSAADAATSLAACLDSHPDLVDKAVEKAPWEKNPADFAEFLAYVLLNRPPEQIRALAARLSPDQAPKTLQATLDKLSGSMDPRELALSGYDPFDLVGSLESTGLMQAGQQSEFSSADGAFRVVYVEAKKPFGNYMEDIHWLWQIKRIARQWATGHPGVALGFTGEPAFVADISSAMQWDMMSSGFLTLMIISAIFWICYRRLRPLRDLVSMLVLVFLLSLATAGLFLKELTIIGAGFASVMIGLSVDYGYFIYQRARYHRGSVGELRRSCLQYIAWTSGTTAAAFFSLNLSSLPGLSQLGNLVGIGVVIGAFVMLGIFAPLTLKFHRSEGPVSPSLIERLFASARFSRLGAWGAIVLVVVLLGGLVIKGPPKADFSADTLRPRVSEAYTAVDQLYAKLADDRKILSLVVTGTDEEQVLRRLKVADAKLTAAQAKGDIISCHSPLPLWPDPGNQRENLTTLKRLAGEIPRLRQAVAAAGFTDDAFLFTEKVLNQWSAWPQSAVPVWPDNETSRWIFRHVASRGEGQKLALGIVEPAPGRQDALESSLHADGVYLVSWEQLGRDLKKTIPTELLGVMAALMTIVILILAFGFRSLRAVVLFVATTALVLACLAGAMSLLGMKWSFFNLAAVLLLLGTGTDYSILLLLALRRNGGDAAAAQNELGPVILLCAISAAAGFGSISWANYVGLAVLGQTCSLGLVIDAAISLFLLPRAWALLPGRRKP